MSGLKVSLRAIVSALFTIAGVGWECRPAIAATLGVAVSFLDPALPSGASTLTPRIDEYINGCYQNQPVMMMMSNATGTNRHVHTRVGGCSRKKVEKEHAKALSSLSRLQNDLQPVLRCEVIDRTEALSIVGNDEGRAEKLVGYGNYRNSKSPSQWRTSGHENRYSQKLMPFWRKPDSDFSAKVKAILLYCRSLQKQIRVPRGSN